MEKLVVPSPRLVQETLNDKRKEAEEWRKRVDHLLLGIDQQLNDDILVEIAEMREDLLSINTQNNKVLSHIIDIQKAMIMMVENNSLMFGAITLCIEKTSSDLAEFHFKIKEMDSKLEKLLGDSFVLLPKEDPLISLAPKKKIEKKKKYNLRRKKR